MDLMEMIKDAENIARSALLDAQDAVKKVKAVKEKTKTFLKLCAEEGLTKVSIGKRHKSIKESMPSSWPFDSEHSIFGIGTGDSRDKDGYPIIWGVASKSGVHAGCGNGNQVQSDTRDLIDGVYHLSKGKWYKIDNEE